MRMASRKIQIPHMIEQNFRDIMERRNKLLLKPEAQDYLDQLAPSVDILERITEQKEYLHVIHGDLGLEKPCICNN